MQMSFRSLLCRLATLCGKTIAPSTKRSGSNRGGRRPFGTGRGFVETLESRVLLAADGLSPSACYATDTQYNVRIVATPQPEGEGVMGPLQGAQSFTVVRQGANPAYDTNGDGVVAPLDVLQIINDLNTFGPRAIAVHNYAPSGPDGSITLEQGKEAVILSPLSDPEGDALSPFIEGEIPTNVVIAPLLDGNFRLTATEVLGAQVVRFGASDSVGNIGYANIVVTVVEGDPVAPTSGLLAHETTTITTAKDTTVIFKEPFFNQGEETISIRVSSQASHGVLGVLGNGVYSYTPEPDFQGVDQVVLSGTIDNETELDAVVQFIVGDTVSPPVDPPADALVGTDTSYQVETGAILDIPNPFEGPNPFTVRVSTAPAEGVISVDGDDFTYVSQVAGRYTIVFAATDDDISEVNAVVTVNVTEAPVSGPLPGEGYGNLYRIDAAVFFVIEDGGVSGQYDNLNRYDDVDYAGEYVNNIVDHAAGIGILDVVAPGSSFYPRNYVTNAELTVMIQSFLGSETEKELNFVDYGLLTGILTTDEANDLAGLVDYTDLLVDFTRASLGTAATDAAIIELAEELETRHFGITGA